MVNSKKDIKPKVKKTVAKTPIKKATSAVKTPVKKEKSVVKDPIKKATSAVKVPVKKEKSVVKDPIKKATSAVKTPVKKEKSVVKSTVKKVKTEPKTPVKKSITPIKVPVKKVKIQAKKAADLVKTPFSSTIEDKTKKSSLFLWSFLNFIKNIFLDISLLYRNIIHWNISKFIIFVWSILLWLISVVPLIIIFFIYSSIGNVDPGILINWLLNGNLSYDIYGNIFVLLIIFIYFVVFSYSNILLFKLNESYIEWKKLWYKDNEYFNIKKIIKFFNLTLLNFSILLLPILWFVIAMLCLFLYTGGIEEVNAVLYSWINNYFSILSLIFLIFSWLTFFYLYYRLIFSYLVFADTKYYESTKNVFSYVKEWFNKTKRIVNLFKFLLIFFLVILFTLPIHYVWALIDIKWEKLDDYMYYSTLTSEQMQEYYPTEVNRYERLKNEYGWLSNEVIDNKIRQNYIHLILFTVFDFIFLYWLFLMIISSFYRRELS